VCGTQLRVRDVHGRARGGAGEELQHARVHEPQPQRGRPPWKEREERERETVRGYVARKVQASVVLSSPSLLEGVDRSTVWGY
jgi:hypothetical protein